MQPRIHPKEVFLACRTLFGHEVRLSPDFLEYLQASGAKAAFRERVKQSHPDRFACQSLHIQNRQSEIFREVVAAFDLITNYIKSRDESRTFSARPKQHSAAGKYNRPTYSNRQHKQHQQPPGPDGHFYRGAVPQRHLEFGSYLYYRGLIPYQTLIEALVWQRRQRPTIGAIARRWNWLNDADILRISRDRGVFGRFGEKAVRLGLLRHSQVQTLLYFQRARQQKIGLFFVQANLLSADQINRLVKELLHHNARVCAAGVDPFARHTAAG